MGSPTFGVPSSNNNAPPPPMGNTNPTGTNNGIGFGTSGAFPSFPVFGAPSSSPISPSANAPLFSASNFSGSGFDLGNNWSSLANSLGKTYGKGAGQAIYNILSEGLFSSQDAAAFLNAMQPSVKQGESSVLNAFGAQGSRFGSAAALGLGNYESQVNLNEQQTIASMDMQAKQSQLSLLENSLPALHAEKANSGSWVDDLIGGLEIAGSIAAAPFTGGASLLALPAGMATLSKGLPSNGGGGGGGATPQMPIPNSINPLLQNGGNTGTFGNNAPLWQYSGGQFDEIAQWDQTSSAAAALGAAAPDTSFLAGIM